MAKPSKEFLSPKTLIPPAGYSHIAKVNSGTIVYLAGQVSSGASGNLIGEGNFEAQVEQVFRNLKIAVEAAGGTMADIVKLNIYLRSGRCAEAACDTRPLRQYREAAGKHAGRRQPAGAAGLARRDRGYRGVRGLKRKTAPVKGAVSSSWPDHAALVLRWRNMMSRASSSISALKTNLSFSAIARAAAGLAEISSTSRFTSGNSA